MWEMLFHICEDRAQLCFGQSKSAFDQRETSAIWDRWDKGYENCILDDIPHKRLTKPARAFTFDLEGTSLPHGRDNILKLDVVQTGELNAMVFWFDLRMDDFCTITSGPFLSPFLNTVQCSCRFTSPAGLETQ